MVFLIYYLKAMMEILWREGCLLKRTISPSLICLSTMSPIWRASACFLLFWIARENLSSLVLIICLAPGNLSGPFRTSCFSLAMLCLFTTSGKVRIWAMNWGRITWSILMLGSGEITVLPVKLDLFPDKFPLNLPFFPFSL